MNAKIKIGFIGGGNMGEAIIKSLLLKKVFSPKAIGVAETDRDKLKKLKRKYGIVGFSDNRSLAERSEIILLAVKPQQMTEVLAAIQPSIKQRPLILSIAAGLDTAYFSKHLPSARLIRIMPNMGLMYGEGASALYAAPGASAKDRKTAEKIFSAGGIALFVENESLLDPITALSGSGPAFVFYFAKALMTGGASLGLSPKTAHDLTLQTLRGAIKILQNSKESADDLIAKVASKGGTTEAGLHVLETRDVLTSIHETLSAAAERAKELRCSS